MKTAHHRHLIKQDKMFLLFLLPAMATVSPTSLKVVGGGNADIANFAWQVDDLEYYGYYYTCCFYSS